MSICGFTESLKIIWKSNFDVFLKIIPFDKEKDIDKFDCDFFQKSLSKINENEEGKKEKGVYYTPEDVSNFVTANTFCKMIKNHNKISNYEDCVELINSMPLKDIEMFLFDKIILDPTSGCGEFLVAALKIKFKILEKQKLISDENILKVVKTIYGNDTNILSNNISKTRLLIIAKIYATDECLLNIAKELNNNFTNYDMLVGYKNEKHFDFLIGNPPYVEKGVFSKYGNIYADVLDNSYKLLKKESSIGFIIPISFVSTPRMKDFRNITENSFKNITILNFADRPSCLFNGVHQKLTLLICSRNVDEKNIFTSKYNYWYKSERDRLFNSFDLANLNGPILDCYPKVSSDFELNILNKLISYNKEECLLKYMKDGNEKIYLNMRGFFWIKAFSFNPGSSEYREFNPDEKYKFFILCLLNSSLFFFFWVAISDCWHITLKELRNFKINISEINLEKFNSLFKKLENKLENTKEYIGTKQADYAFKHKKCKNIIDLIDDELANVYKLTYNELNFVKNYAAKYRTGEEK